MASPSPLYNTDFARAIARNQRNTILLVGVLLAISAVLGYVLGWGVGILQVIWNLPPDEVSRLTAGAVLADLVGPPRPQALWGAALMLGAGALWGLITITSGERILAAFSGARDANPDDVAERRFIDVVQEMALAAGIPAPRPMVVETDALNAFATGFSPGRAMITATSGILQACTREELQGVIGHEMGHVADYDVRYTTMVAAMAGVVVLIAHLLGDIARWSFYAPRGSSREDRAGGARMALTLVVLAVMVVFVIAAPIAAKLVQLAISRQREYLADAASAKLTRNPVGLIHALQRLADSDTSIARASSPVSALCIANPEHSAFADLFSTHPPIPDRIARLRNLGGVAIAAEQEAPLPPVAPPPHHHGPWDADGNAQAPPPGPPPGHHGPWG